jgi:hypothetical protein
MCVQLTRGQKCEATQYHRRRKDVFQTCLWQVNINTIRTYSRGRLRRPTRARKGAVVLLERLSDANTELPSAWDPDHDKHVVEKLLALVQPNVSSTTWAAFERFGGNGVPAGQVTAEHSLSENADTFAKFRVHRPLRQ